MGYMRHDAVIVVVPGYVMRGESAFQDEIPVPDIEAFRASLPAEWQALLIGPVKSVVNDFVSYVFMPDGSKEGWGDSDAGDDYRGAFVALFDAMYSDGSSPFDGARVEIRYGGDEPGAGYEPDVIVTTFPREPVRAIAEAAAVSLQPESETAS